jgi:tartrate dehydrogenase/decarboxylase / D-malate dehydrogenase
VATTRSSSAPSAGPPIVPDHISLWGSLLLFRREFDQYVNLRPVR